MMKFKTNVKIDSNEDSEQNFKVLIVDLAHLAYRDTFADNFKQIGYQYLGS